MIAGRNIVPGQSLEHSVLQQHIEIVRHRRQQLLRQWTRLIGIAVQHQRLEIENLRIQVVWMQLHKVMQHLRRILIAVLVHINGGERIGQP